MNGSRINILFLAVIITALSCSSFGSASQTRQQDSDRKTLLTGAERMDEYLPLLQNMTVAVTTNHSALVHGKHLIDTLLARGVRISKIFSPEHGFRGDADAGALIDGGTDPATGLQVISLYGARKKPSANDMKHIDIMIFDIQDVGVRFYTYISTLTLVMEACAEQRIPLLVLDRPNPNGFYVDGPVLRPGFESFVGMHPVPVVHGMTVGEYAQMVNGEGWLKKNATCDLQVIRCEGYTHGTLYHLPVKPSPNLPDMESVYLYPSLCFFEGTFMSVGRGTSSPFRVIGHPEYAPGNISFTPVSVIGAATNPPFMNTLCRGFDYSHLADSVKAQKRLFLEPLFRAAAFFEKNPKFFNTYFNTLAGSDEMQKQIKSGMGYSEIRRLWSKELEAFKAIRNKYLLYPD